VSRTVAISHRSRDHLVPPCSLRSRALARLRLHAQLRLEPAEFQELVPLFAQAEGWRYFEDLALLYLLARDVPGPGVTLEVGSYKGLATTALGKGVEAGGHAPVHTVDPHTGDRQALEEAGRAAISSEADLLATIRRASLGHVVRAHTMTSHELVTYWNGEAIRILFVDGWHSYEAVRADLEDWIPHLDRGGVVLVDDYANYDEVRSAVEDSAYLLPRVLRRAGRMVLASEEELPQSVNRYLRIPWG